MAIKIKTQEEIELIRKSCEVLSNALAEVVKAAKAGTNGLALDKLAEEYIKDHGGKPSFKGYHGFPNSLCISMNDDVVHGIPTATPYKDGDIISLDCGVYMNGYHGDMAYTIGIGNVKPEIEKLMRVTKESLLLGIEFATAGRRTGDIGFAIQEYCERKNPYKCVRELVGHGIGKTLHEDPQVPNYGRKGDGAKLPENCVIAIEPMVNLGKKDVYTKKDNWTIATQDGTPSVHFEHTVLVKPIKAEILTSFAAIEKAVQANPELVKI
ncbi:MAG TPA: type I methionyl aminopeptidase [Chitinophagales bacterium]|nr:type I methionyl aminopeptidase [Chitinophagales bacterium]